MGSAQRSNFRDTVRRRHATLESLLRNGGGRSDEFRLRLAFHKACAILQLSDEDDAFTELVAEKIIEVAKTAESDPERLCSRALDGLSGRKAS